MADHRIDPRGVKPSDTNLDILTTIGGVAQWAPPAAPPSLLVIVVNGEPGFVFDDNGELIYVEG